MPSIVDSYSETNQDSDYAGNGTTRQQLAQSITGDGSTLDSAKFYLKKGIGSPSGNLTVQIFAHTGTFGTSSAPTGGALATSDNVAASGVSSTSYSLFTFTFSGANRITLTNGIHYIVAVNIVNNVTAGYDGSSPSHAGNYYSDFDGVVSIWDTVFYVYGVSASSTFSTDQIAITFSGNVTTTQTTTGVARITILTTKTITGVARITAATLKTITGVARITVTTLKTITGVARIQKTVSQIITGLARITVATLRTISGVARIQALTSQTITGLGRITATTLRTITGVARLTATTLQAISGKADIRKATNQTGTGVSRIQVTTLATNTGKGRVTATTVQTETGKADILNTTLQTSTGVARIQKTTTRTSTGVARIQQISSQTSSGTSRILITTLQMQTGTAAIGGATTQTNPGVSRIAITSPQTETGTAHIVGSVVPRSISGKARILSTVSAPGPRIIFLLDGRVAIRLAKTLYLPL